MDSNESLEPISYNVTLNHSRLRKTQKPIQILGHDAYAYEKGFKGSATGLCVTFIFNLQFRRAPFSFHVHYASLCSP